MMPFSYGIIIEGGVIDEIDRKLKEWSGSIAGKYNAEIRLSTPQNWEGQKVVGVYLLDLLNAPPTRDGRRPSLQIGLRYLITAWHENPEEAHRMLGDLVSAAMSHPLFEIELEPLPVLIWTAFGLAPRPSFLVRLPLSLAQPEPEVKRVRRPMELRGSIPIPLEGIIIGHDEIPIVGARVELVALRQTMQTDGKGRFRFPAVPAEPVIKRLRISAKGYESFVDIENDPSTNEPHVIHFTAMEA